MNDILNSNTDNIISEVAKKATQTRKDILELFDIVRKSEDIFDPFMVKHLLSEEDHEKWCRICITQFIDFVYKIENFNDFKQAVMKEYGPDRVMDRTEIFERLGMSDENSQEMVRKINELKVKK